MKIEYYENGGTIMKRAVCVILALILCLAAVPFAAAEQTVEGTVLSVDTGFLTLELENGNVVLLNCNVDTDAEEGDKVSVTYTGKLGVSAEVRSITVLSSGDGSAFRGTVTATDGDTFTVVADTGARITFYINESTYLTGSLNGLQTGMEVSVTYTGDITSSVYAGHITVLSEPDTPAPTKAPSGSALVRRYGRPVTSASQLSVGDTVTFGSYEQDGYTGNGKEAIEWTVLDKRGSSVLLLSVYGLDMHVYNSETVKTTWASSSIRSFLNGTFLNTAFNTAEQRLIETTYVDNSSSQGNRESLSGPATYDKVFLLSFRETFNYLPTPYDRMCLPTRYAVQRYAMVSGKFTKDGEYTTYWWLRSSGRTDLVALLIMSDGSEGHDNVSWGYHASDNMYNSGGCIRPAVWITLG